MGECNIKKCNYYCLLFHLLFVVVAVIKFYGIVSGLVSHCVLNRRAWYSEFEDLEKLGGITCLPYENNIPFFRLQIPATYFLEVRRKDGS